MIGRRDFMRGAALVTLTSGCEMELRSRSPRAAGAPPLHPATHHPIATEYPPLPPLPSATFRARRGQAQALARKAGAAALVVPSGSTSFTWLAGASFGRSERLIALVIPSDGDPFLVVPSFEAERVARRVLAVRVAPWEENESPYEVLAKTLGEARAQGALLLDPHAEYGTAESLARALPKTTTAPATSLLDGLRVKKSDEELVRMRRAIAITEDAIAATFARVAIGMSDADLRAIVRDEHEKRGVEGDALVQIGADAALPHGSPSGAKVAPDTVVLIDGGCTVEGYWSDISRTRYVGAAPSPRFRAIYNLVHDAQSAAIAAVKPGALCAAIDGAGRETIARGGFGPQFTHRLGHGIGLDGHETPYMVRGNGTPLEVGNVFSVEPGIYLPGELGVRLEDDVACGESGPIVLSRRAPRA